ncbi:MAG: hypothetical protein DCC71_09140 [Proteobacteria bacterium]|nr:MAG: hypothetical protein DCC71_09140 [Pseudomonadota bacterium]
MDAKCRALCETLARAIVARDFAAAHALFAPWLRSALSPAEIQAAVDAQSEGLAHPPRSWTLDEGVVGLDELRTPDPYGPPSSPLSDRITHDDFRGWLQIQFAPDPSVHDEQNVCFDVWLVAVEHEGTFLVGYFEPSEAT